MKNIYKRVLVLSIVSFLGLGVFILVPKLLSAGTDYIGGDYFQCSRHGFHEKQNCAATPDYFPRSDYTVADLSYQILGHRHGSSNINTTVCLIYSDPYNPEGTCGYYTCSGYQCGQEYGNNHPWNILDSGFFTVQAKNGSSGFYIRRSAFVEDAEVRIFASASAHYPEIVIKPKEGEPLLPGDFSLSVNKCVSGGNSDLSWSASQYATSYDIYAKVWTTGTWNKIGSTLGTSFTASQILDTDYYYYVKAINSAGTKDSDPNGGVFGGNCSSNPPPPGSYPPPVCSPANQTVQAGVNVSFSATGGNNNYIWSAPSGTPTSGGATNFVTQFGVPGNHTVTVTSTNQTASCVVNVTASIWVDKPLCSNDPYTATINWGGLTAARLDPTNVALFVDVTTDPTFNTMWNKRFQNLPIPASTVALTGFSCLEANFCLVTPVGEIMSLQPDKTYYTRIYGAPVYGGAGTHYPSSAGISFKVPRCSPPAPTKPVWVGAPVCAASTGTYVVNIDWEGAPNPDFGTYVDIDTDSNWDDVNLYDWWNKNIPFSSSVTETNSNGFDGLYPNVNSRLIMHPGTNYYARIYTAYPAWGVHSATSDVLNVPICTLDATLVANPSSGASPLNVTLTATKISGLASGLITYQFDCTNDGSFEGTVGPTLNTTASYSGCPAYPSKETAYLAKVKITQKDSFGQDVVEEKTTPIISSVALKPNLKSMAVGPNMVNAGTNQTFFSRISNESSVPVSTDFPYYFMISESIGGAGPYISKPHSIMTNTLGANSTDIVSVSHNFSTAGKYSIRLCADKTSPAGGGVIDESNEDDNCGPWSDVDVLLPPPTAVPSGTLTIPLCTIAIGASTCNTNVSWNTQNLVDGDVITIRKDNVNILSGNSNPGVSNNLTWGGHTFLLVRNANLTLPLDNIALNIDCVSGASWNGSKCEAIIPQVLIRVDNPVVGGKVIDGSNIIICGSMCIGSFNKGSTITLTATPNSSYWEFDKWTGACANSKLPKCVLNMNSDKTVGAKFILRDFKYHEF